MIERIRRPTFGTLEIDATIDDPKAYTKPWTVRVNQRLLVDTELIEFVCLENQKFNGRGGKYAHAARGSTFARLRGDPCRGARADARGLRAGDDDRRAVRRRPSHHRRR